MLTLVSTFPLHLAPNDCERLEVYSCLHPKIGSARGANSECLKNERLDLNRLDAPINLEDHYKNLIEK